MYDKDRMMSNQSTEKNTAMEFIYFQRVHHSTNQNHQLGKECQEKMRHAAVTDQLDTKSTETKAF